MVGNRAMAAMERGVEASDLRQVGRCSKIARIGARLFG